MKNLLEPEDLNFKYSKHITCSTYSHMCFRDEDFKVQWEQITNRDGHGKSGNPKNYYFIDGIEREFVNLEELCKCWNERRNFDDPNNEIIWEKRVVPIVNLNSLITK